MTTGRSIAEARERAERGAKELDDIHGGWWREINLATLSMASCAACVLGQLYGYYPNAPEHLTGYDDGEVGGSGVANGFDVGDGVTYEQLNKVWKDLIEERRAAAAA